MKMMRYIRRVNSLVNNYILMLLYNIPLDVKLYRCVKINNTFIK